MISVVIPIYNEDKLIDELFSRTKESISLFSEDFEIICVDDGSNDRSLEKLLECHHQDNRFKVISFSRNFGHQTAIFAGLSYAKGDYIGIMDGDLQDPPELFATFFEKLKEGYDIVYGVRKKRKESFPKKFSYWLYYRILSITSDIKIPIDSGDFSLFTRKVRDHMLETNEHNLFIRGIRSWVGFRQAPFEYERSPRHHGQPKYSLNKLKKLAADGLFGYSHVPIKLLGRAGTVIILLCLLYSIYTVYEKYFLGITPKGFTTLIIAIFFFSGVQLVSLRVIGEYVVRIHDEVKKRPRFIIKEKHLD